MIKDSMFVRTLVGCACAACFACTSLAAEDQNIPRPKAIIYFYADDLGYGDTGCYGATKIPTPHIDKLAEQGVRFTNAHSTTSVCTPSRYAVMTGEYPWRRKGVHILPGDAPLIVPTADRRMTLPSMLKKAGYKTCAVGKWHLGLGNGEIDWNKPISPNPRDVGFDESYIMAATADRVPCVYIRNGIVENLDPDDPIEISYKKKIPGVPTGREHPEALRYSCNNQHMDTIINGISRIGFMKGGKSALWKDCDLADDLTNETIAFIEKNKETPFFLYFATNDIHTPRDPHGRFLGKSQCGIRGDAVVQLDDCLGRIVQALEKAGIKNDTLIIFSSDNGPVVIDGYYDGALKDLNGHRPSGPWKGGKYSLDEGGTRVPFIVSWPGHTADGTTSDALISQMDLAASLAALTRQTYPDGVFPDSQNLMSTLLGQKKQGRKNLVEQALSETRLAMVSGDYKYIPSSSDNRAKKKSSDAILYNLKNDPGETDNIAKKYPELVQKIHEEFLHELGTK